MVVQKLCACGGASPNTRLLHISTFLAFLWCKFSTFPTCFGPLHQESWFFFLKILVFHRICSLLTQNDHVFRNLFTHDLSSFDAKFPTVFQALAPLHQQILVFLQDLFSSDAKISHVFFQGFLFWCKISHGLHQLCPQSVPRFSRLSSSDAKFPTFFHISDPISPRNLGFFTGFVLFRCKMSHVFPHFLPFGTSKPWVLHRTCPLLMQNFPRFSFSDAKFPTFLPLAWPYCTKTPSLFWYKISYVFHHFWPYRTKNVLGFFTGFSIFWCKFSHIPHFWLHSAKNCAQTNKNTHTHTHNGANRICKDLQIFWPKTIFVCKAIFYIFKNKSARIYWCKANFYIFGNYSPKQKFMYVIILAGMVMYFCHWGGETAH